jgi:esterase/lipase superfamily enzyme
VFETERPGVDRPKRIRIGQIMLAAPDIARPVFEQKIRRIAPHANRVTVYTSARDGALYLAGILRRGALRTGEIDGTNEPQLIEIKNVHVVDATGPFDWWRLAMGYGHDYFQQGGGVQSDIKNILMSTGDKEFLTPDARSPALFTKSEYKANKDWFYWKLRTEPAQNSTTIPKK